MNSFSLGAQIGGSASHERERRASEQELRNLFNAWKGEYSSAIREFAFLLRIDGDIHAYTRMWQIVGAQPAKRKRHWVEVEIGVPVYWYPRHANMTYQELLAHHVEKGFHSMVDLLERNKHPVDGARLLQDWSQIKEKYLRRSRQPN